MTEAKRRANKRWRERHPEKWRAYHAKWQREHPEKCLEYVKRCEFKKVRCANGN